MQKKITLSNGTEVEVGQMSWLGFKKLKALIAKTVSGPVLRETVDIVSGPLGGIVGDLLQSIAAAVKPSDGTDAQAALAMQLTEKWGDAQTMAMVLGGLDQLKTSLANVLGELLETSDEFTELLIAYATNDMAFDDLQDSTISDVMQLREAVLESNDLGSLFEMEKNWWGRVISSGKACLGTPTSPSPGTSTTNIG